TVASSRSYQLDLVVSYRSVLSALFRFDRLRVVPEVEAVYVAVVEPQPDLVRMIDSFSGARIDGISPGDDSSVCSSKRIKDRLLDRDRPDVGCERFASDRDVNTPVCFIGDDLHVLRFIAR